MNQEEVKLLGICGSPFSNRVELALKMKGIPYEWLEEEDAWNNKSPFLLKYNPVHKKIPVFVHNGKPIAESLVIVEYIEEKWPENHRILPEDPYERAMARFWAKYVDEKAVAALWKACWSPESEREKAIEEATECLNIVENELGERKFFGGEKIGLVDIAANFIGFWLEIVQEASGTVIFTPEKFPKLQKWTEEFVGHGVVKETLPPKDRLLAFYKAIGSTYSSK